MSNQPDISPEQIKKLQKWLARQRCNAYVLYAISLLMLTNTAYEFHSQNIKTALACGAIGWLDCYVADKTLNKYREVRQILDKYKKKYNIK